MLIQAFQDGACEDLAAIPVYIGYDRVIEEKAYLKELGGGEKEKESPSDIFKSGRVLRKRYGRVYVNIGEPIFLKSYLASQESSFLEMTLPERQSLYRKIGYDLVHRINQVSVVTPFSLVAAGLLCHDRRGIAHQELMDVLNIFYDYLAFRCANRAETLANREKAIGDALEMFVQSDFISKMGEEEESPDEVAGIVYSLADDKRLNLEYYKNNILHFFIPVSFVAMSLVSRKQDTLILAQLLSDYQFFKRLFRKEFIFDEQKDDLDEVNDVLDYLNLNGFIAGFESDGKAWIALSEHGRKNLMFFAGLIRNYFESYWVVIRGCSYLKKGAKQEKDWLENIQGLGTRMYQMSDIKRSEALSTSNYKSAVSFLLSEEILSLGQPAEKGGRKEMVYSLAGSRLKLEALRRRVFKFL